jgi:hypothetical protein
MRNIELIRDEIQSPEIQTMYSLGMPVSAIRTKIRQEFEKHRYVSQLNVVDVLLFQSHAEFQVSFGLSRCFCSFRIPRTAY